MGVLANGVPEKNKKIFSKVLTRKKPMLEYWHKEERKTKRKKIMTVYVARVQGWEDSYTLGVFTTEEEAMEAGRLYVQERELEDYSWVAEKFQVQGA